MDNSKIISPSIRILEQKINSRDANALNEFWDMVGANGSPIIEDIEGDLSNCIATVVWRQTRDIDNIFVFGEAFGGEMFGEEGKKTNLTNLPGTDLWHRSVVVPKNTRSLYIFAANVSEDYSWDDNDFIVDPLNPKRYTVPLDDEHPDSCSLLYRTETVMELPEAKEKIWIKERSDGKKGSVRLVKFKSTILDNERRVWIYTPWGYKDENEEMGLALFTDGWEYVNLVRAPEIFDNLIADSIISPMCGAFIESLENRSEELTMNPRFLQFITAEILPWVRENYNVTNDQSKTIIAGCSLGGLFAAYAALNHSDIFGRILSQSGAFYYRIDENGQPGPDMDGNSQLAGEYFKTPKLPLEFYMNIGVFEKIFHHHVKASDKMAVTLKSKGYKVVFEEFPGGHIYNDWQDNLADGLKALCTNLDKVY